MIGINEIFYQSILPIYSTHAVRGHKISEKSVDSQEAMIQKRLARFDNNKTDSKTDADEPEPK
jgi:hypothetical protein